MTQLRFKPITSTMVIREYLTSVLPVKIITLQKKEFMTGIRQPRTETRSAKKITWSGYLLPLPHAYPVHPPATTPLTRHAARQSTTACFTATDRSAIRERKSGGEFREGSDHPFSVVSSSSADKAPHGTTASRGLGMCRVLTFTVLFLFCFLRRVGGNPDDL